MRFPTRNILAFVAGAVLLTGLAVSQKNNTPEAMLRAAMDKETVDGDLKAAIEQYKKVIAQKGASKDVVATALVRLGGAYEKQGSAEARPLYERVVREFADQVDAVQQAHARLDANPTKTSGMAIRKVCVESDCDGDAISPDGRYLTVRVDGNISVRDLMTGHISQITHVTAGVTLIPNGGVLWAPDSKRVAYSTADTRNLLQNFASLPYSIATQQTDIVNLDGSGTRTVYRGGHAYSWSPDGRRLLVASDEPPFTKLLWVGVADGVVQTLSAARSLGKAAVSPDGSYIAFNANKERGSALNVYVMTSDGSGETIVSATQARQEPVGWTPDGRYLLFSENSGQANRTSLWAVPINGGKPGVPVLVHRDFGSDSLSFLGVTRNGAVNYRILTNTSEIFTASMDPSTGKITSPAVPLPVPHGEPIWGPRWSPDGRRILYFFGMVPEASGSPNARNKLAIYSLDSGKNQQVASDIPVIRWATCWADDAGSLLLDVSHTLTAPDNLEPIRYSLNTGEATPLFPGAAFFTMTSCAGELVSNYDRSTLRLRNVKTRSETEIHKYTQRIGFTPLLSHNSRWVAFGEYLADGMVGLFVVSTEGGPARELTRVKPPGDLPGAGPRSLAWSPDDRFVYFHARPDSKAPYELFRVSASGGTAESTGLTRPHLAGSDIAPDGKHLAFVDGVLQQPEIWAMENYLPVTPPKK